VVVAFSDVQKIAEDLDRAGVIDLDQPLKNFLAAEGLTELKAGQGTKAPEAAGYVAAWEHYVVVCGITDIGRVVEEIRALSD